MNLWKEEARSAHVDRGIHFWKDEEDRRTHLFSSMEFLGKYRKRCGIVGKKQRDQKRHFISLWQSGQRNHCSFCRSIFEQHSRRRHRAVICNLVQVFGGESSHGTWRLDFGKNVGKTGGGRAHDIELSEFWRRPPGQT